MVMVHILFRVELKVDIVVGVYTELKKAEGIRDDLLEQKSAIGCRTASDERYYIEHHPLNSPD